MKQCNVLNFQIRRARSALENAHRRQGLPLSALRERLHQVRPPVQAHEDPLQEQRRPTSGRQTGKKEQR